jgi:putative transposase
MKQMSHKFRIYPNIKQEEILNKSIKVTKWIYNYFLAEQKHVDLFLQSCGLSQSEVRSFKKSIGKSKENSLYFNKNEASRELTLLVNTTHPHLSEVDSTLRANVLENLDIAFKNIYKKGQGFPKFKNIKSSNSYSGQIIYNSKPVPQNFKISKYSETSKFCTINIPKIKNIKCVIHKDEFKYYWNSTSMKLNSYTISKTVNNEWYISIQVENKDFIETKLKDITFDSVLGIDMGIKRPITTSDSADFNNKIFSKTFDDLKEIDNDIKRLNKIISTKMLRNKDYKNSNKYYRIRNKINILQNKIKNKRENKLHNITSQLTNKDNISVIVLEDLKICNMTKRAKNTNVKQKSGLNKAILNIGFFSLYTKLNYKAKEKGISLVKVNPRNTSSTCSCCGNVNKRNRKSQSDFECIECGHKDNADFNASKNIKNLYTNTLELIN